ncbi:unnamed protein product [Lactuca virosa]|uniref:Uncharacterized protein n=1 Tax=Lactuca virosa TaxID=75947 RepID=A0AAU9PS81_9ASTR|nr:unnamed protein product [Lactuca virosa]
MESMDSKIPNHSLQKTDPHYFPTVHLLPPNSIPLQLLDQGKEKSWKFLEKSKPNSGNELHKRKRKRWRIHNHKDTYSISGLKINQQENKEVRSGRFLVARLLSCETGNGGSDFIHRFFFFLVPHCTLYSSQDQDLSSNCPYRPKRKYQNHALLLILKLHIWKQL